MKGEMEQWKAKNEMKEHLATGSQSFSMSFSPRVDKPLNHSKDCQPTIYGEVGMT